MKNRLEKVSKLVNHNIHKSLSICLFTLYYNSFNFIPLTHRDDAFL